MNTNRCKIHVEGLLYLDNKKLCQMKKKTKNMALKFKNV